MTAKSPEAFGLTKEEKGLEIAPWFNPFVPKSRGFNVKTLDFVDFETLLAKAKADNSIDPSAYDRLEPLDYIGSATELSDLIPSAEHRSFDYIFSSHNFEHLPNPIKFLRACETLLKPGGRVIMMVPDCRICFDYFHAHKTLGEWLQAYLEDRKKPSLKQVYDFLSDHAHSIVDLPPLDAISDKTPRQAISVKTDIGELWENWQNSTEDSPYQEVHCTFMTPSSLELLIEDCRHLNLIGLEVFDVSEARGVEFKVHLVKPINPSPVVATANYRERRSELLHRIWDEHASRGNVRGKGIGQLFKRRQASSGQNALRLPLKEKLRSLNRRRLHRRRQK